MSNMKTVVSFMNEVKDALRSDPHISIDNEHTEGGSYTKVCIGTDDKYFRMKVGRGRYKDFR